MKGIILSVENEASYNKLYQKQLECFLEGKEIPTLLVAKSVDESRKLFNEHHENIIAIILDGTIDGPSAPNDNGSEIYPNSAVLVKEFRTRFVGPIVASSNYEGSRDILMGEGCDHQCDNKGHVIQFIIKLLGL